MGTDKPVNGIAEVLKKLKGKCIVVTLVNGKSITGFDTAVFDDVLVMTVAGVKVFVVIGYIVTVQKAAQNAC